jgi:hypothetical protein
MKTSPGGALTLSGRGLQQVKQHIEGRFAVVHDSLAAELLAGAERDMPDLTLLPTRSLDEKAAPILRAAERRFTQMVRSHDQDVYFITPPVETAEVLFEQSLAALDR